MDEKKYRSVLGDSGAVYGRYVKGAVVRSISRNAPVKASRLLGINALDGSLFHCAIVQGKKL